MRPSSKFPRLAVLGLAATLLTSTGPVAATDTAEADRLRAVFEDYLGHPAPGQPSVVAVTPVGEVYEVAIDRDRLVAPLSAAFGVETRLGHHVLRLKPRQDGTWTMTSDRFDPMSWSAGIQSGRMDFEGFHGEGVYSADLTTSGELTDTADRVVSENTVAARDGQPRIDIRRIDEGVALSIAIRPSTDGVGNVARLVHSARSSTDVFSLSEGAAAGIPDMEATLKMGASQVVADVTGLRYGPLLALWRHLVAHHDRLDFTTGQADLKARLRDLGPLFERMKQTATIDSVEIETPVGFGGAGRVEATIDLTGAVAESDADVTVAVTGFELHSLFLPGWANRLVPRDLTLHTKVAGWDAAAALALVLDRADFAGDKPIDDAAVAEIATRLLPKGGVTVDLAGNRAVATDWNVDLDGRLTVGPAGAAGEITLKARGLENAVSALRDPAAGEAAGKAAEELSLALSFAESRDGALVWRFAFHGADVTVNGRSIGAGRPL
jgi:hypothetical protein